MASAITKLTNTMDQLYEYDREPIPPEKFQPGRYYAGLLAGEHVAGTEFVIGAYFVLHGVRAADLFLGLFLGNLLAVLSWTFICAPIATDTRLTLYWYLRRIAGPGLTLIYNIANGVLFCILAGAMISVSATAVGISLGIPAPALDDVLPHSGAWILTAFVIGMAFTLLAILGFKTLSRFGGVCSPWIFVAFAAGAIATLPRLGVHPNLDNLWQIAHTKIWTGVPTAGQEKFGLWHVLFFAWFCNLAMHVGLSDLALFRFARHWSYGLYSAFGMYLGHYLAWICSGVMVVAVNREMNPGLMAVEALGISGAAAVLLAGWTTANPTLYRAGMAFQCIIPSWSRWKVTLLAGLITTFLACFPVFFLKLLDFVALYGLVLMPVGAIVFAEHWLFPKLGLEQYVAEKYGISIRWSVLLVWVGTLAACAIMPLHLFYRWLPGYGFALVSYIAIEVILKRNRIAKLSRSLS